MSLRRVHEILGGYREVTDGLVKMLPAPVGRHWAQDAGRQEIIGCQATSPENVAFLELQEQRACAWNGTDCPIV